MKRAFSDCRECPWHTVNFNPADWKKYLNDNFATVEDYLDWEVY